MLALIGRIACATMKFLELISHFPLRVLTKKNSTSKAQKVGSRVPCYCLQRLYTVISRRAYVGAGLLHRTETEARLLELRTRALPFLPQPIPQGAVCFFFADSIFYVKPTMRLFNGLLLKFILDV